MSLKPISPAHARKLADAGARLIDIRSPDEYARVRVGSSENHPVDSITRFGAERPVIFMCRSGMRTGAHAQHLSANCDGEAYVLEGGLDAWRKAGLGVIEDTGQPIEIMRQVQIAAGSLVLLGVVLGLLVSPVWLGLAAFVGAGLVMAGTTGWCGMAKLLARMPWNRRPAGTAAA